MIHTPRTRWLCPGRLLRKPPDGIDRRRIWRWPDHFRTGFSKAVQRFNAGWSSPVARQAHNLKVIGSNPIPATNYNAKPRPPWLGFLFWGKPTSRQRLIAGRVRRTSSCDATSGDRKVTGIYSWDAISRRTQPLHHRASQDGVNFPAVRARTQLNSLNPTPEYCAASRPWATRRQPDPRKQIAPDSVDAVERGHDISCTVDPGHCSGARYGRTAKHRSRHRAF